MNRFGATLTWEPPEYDGGSPIIGYVVELRSKGSIKWEPTMTTGADELSCVLTDVVENEEYFFRVRAQNIVGVGKPSPATHAVKIMDPIRKYASTNCNCIMSSLIFPLFMYNMCRNVQLRKNMCCRYHVQLDFS